MHALLMRELSTRYGRDNVGFLWLILEPMVFASGVSMLWPLLRPPFENGIKLVPFIITGYLPLILVRQIIGYSVNGVRSNRSLLYHRHITPLHLLCTRILLEFIGVTLAGVTIISIYNILGLMSVPTDFLGLGYIYGGWFLTAWFAAATALVMASLAEIFEFVERFVQIVTYLMIPLSGAFWMAASMSPKARNLILTLPFIHQFEMIRRGYFGTSIATYFDAGYEVVWCACLTLLGLLLVQYVRGRVEALD
jgi:capsular polysaccharide transport system permease protein